jgi:hypothetical protein
MTTKIQSMNASKICSLRLTNQGLSEPGFKKPADVVRWLGAVQAQDYHAAKWALALRLKEPTDASIEQAFNKGHILRTHVMRPTWHFVNPADIRWMLELTAPRLNARCSHYYRRLNLDDRLFKRAHRTVEKALRDEQYLTRAELRERLERDGIEPGESVRMGFILIHAELDGLICSGPRKGRQFTYALLDQRVGDTKRLNRDEALATLTLRYFNSHGPATVRDFSWWSGLTIADVKSGLKMVDTKLHRETIEGTDYWFPPAASSKVPDVLLLPPFDEYLVAYAVRNAAVNTAFEGSNDPIFNSVVITKGLVSGRWNRKISPKGALIEIRSYDGLASSIRRAMSTAAENYGKYLGVPVQTRFH